MKQLYRIKKAIARHMPAPLVEWVLAYRWPLYAGRRFYCNFCDTHFRRMVPGGCLEPVCEELQIIGMGYQPNMTCPRCGAINRWRLLYEFLRIHTDVFTAKRRLLHIAPEAHLQTRFRALPDLDYLSVDLENPIAMRSMNITRLDLPDQSYDAVLCSHVLEHIPDDRSAMREIFRVLKPGGWAILQVPLSPVLNRTIEDASVQTPEDRNRRYGQPDHVRVYGIDYPQRLEEAGFVVRRIAAHEAIAKEKLRQLAVDPRESIFLCFRPPVVSIPVPPDEVAPSMDYSRTRERIAILIRKLLGPSVSERARLLFRGFRYARIWDYIEIDGWLAHGEAIALYETARSLPDDRPVVCEIGSWVGKSSVVIARGLLGKPGATLYCIDPFNAEGESASAPVYEARKETFGTPLQEVFTKNIRRRGLQEIVRPIRGYSHDAIRNFNTPLDFLFIDGDHSYEGVLRDFTDWTPLLKPGGYLAFHDVSFNNVDTGPQRVIREKVLNSPDWVEHRHIQSLFIMRRKP
jgi:SAM-dependent methyltransferase